MTAVLPPFALHRPTTTRDALDLVGEDALAYCGGTELLLAMKAGLLRPAALVDLKGIADLRAIRTSDGGLRIGATATHDDVSRHPDVVSGFPLLANTARRVGNPRVRVQGTIGGNLCFAEPKSDLLPLLLAMDASLELASTDGVRTVPMNEFIEGPYWTVREERELLTAVTIPRPISGVYLKYQTMERPTVGVALTGADASYQLAIGAACEVPMAFTFASLGDVDADDVAGEIDPIADLTGSEEYKRHVTAVYVRRAVLRFREEFEGE